MHDSINTMFQFGLIPKSVMKDSELSIKAKAVYAYLCSYAGNDGSAFPSRSLITHELGITNNSFHKYMKELKDSGYVEVDRKQSDTGKFGRCIYTLNDTPRIKTLDVEPCIKTPCIKTPYMANEDTTINNTTKNNINNKQIYTQLFDYWNQKANENPKALTKHKTQSNAMNKAIDRAKKSLGKDFDLNMLIDRFCECHKKSGKMSKRTLQEFFGQKSYQKDWLICEDFTDEGSTWLYWKNKGASTQTAIPGVNVVDSEVPEGYEDY